MRPRPAASASPAAAVRRLRAAVSPARGDRPARPGARRRMVVRHRLFFRRPVLARPAGGDRRSRRPDQGSVARRRACRLSAGCAWRRYSRRPADRPALDRLCRRRRARPGGLDCGCGRRAAGPVHLDDPVQRVRPRRGARGDDRAGGRHRVAGGAGRHPARAGPGGRLGGAGMGARRHPHRISMESRRRSLVRVSRRGAVAGLVGTVRVEPDHRRARRIARRPHRQARADPARRRLVGRPCGRVGGGAGRRVPYHAGRASKRCRASGCASCRAPSPRA